MWIFFVNFCPNITKNFLVNILVIWDGRCDFFFCSLPVSGRKKGWGQKKSSENSPFFVFFLKNDQILTNTKTFKIRFFFHWNAQQVHNIVLNTFQILLGWNKHIRILFWHFYSTCGKKILFWEKLKFFSQGIYCCFWKKWFFYFFAFLEKFVILWKKKNILTPSF